MKLILINKKSFTKRVKAHTTVKRTGFNGKFGKFAGATYPAASFYFEEGIQIENTQSSSIRREVPPFLGNIYIV
jgi:hypothetical protein